MNEQLKQKFIEYLQQKSGALTEQQLEAYIQQLGEEGLKQEYAKFMLMIQSAKLGAKLNYINKLRGVCPEGFEVEFFQQGGKPCRKCVQRVKVNNDEKTLQNTIDSFKCGRKMKKKAEGGPVTETRTTKERDGESGSYKVTRKLTVNPTTKDSIMTISGRPGQKPETINNRTTSKHYWNSEVRDWKKK